MRKIGLAVSGGADSVALLALMAGLREEHGFEAVVLHVDHGMRVDSGEDAKYVEELAARYGMEFRAERTVVKQERGESPEMAARRVRLAFFGRMTEELGLDAIATGHHADDVAETFLMRLARGSGAEGLAGLKQISRVKGITFIRPLLNVRDAQLREYLRERGIGWREDSTNSDTGILRNKVRHVILPFLRENLDARITEHICKSAAILRGDLEKPEPASGAAGGADGEAEEEREWELRIEEGTGWRVHGEGFGEFPAECEMSRRALAGRKLEVRRWREGDRIAPIGMGGRTKKLQDVFVTEKAPPGLRRALPLVADAETGEVLWVPGYRIAEAVAVEGKEAPCWKMKLIEVK